MKSSSSIVRYQWTIFCVVACMLAPLVSSQTEDPTSTTVPTHYSDAIRSLTLTADIQLDQLESACKVLDTIKAVQDFNQSNRVEDLGEVKRKHLSAMSRISEGVSKDLCKWMVAQLGDQVGVEHNESCSTNVAASLCLQVKAYTEAVTTTQDS